MISVIPGSLFRRQPIYQAFWYFSRILYFFETFWKCQYLIWNLQNTSDFLCYLIPETNISCKCWDNQNLSKKWKNLEKMKMPGICQFYFPLETSNQASISVNSEVVNRVWMTYFPLVNPWIMKQLLQWILISALRRDSQWSTWETSSSLHQPPKL